MTTTPNLGHDLDPFHRTCARELFNYVWTLLRMERRTAEQDDEMVHAAHASRWHWGRVGAPVNLARGEWQIARVYAVLGRTEPALHHARRCREIAEQHQLGPFDLACASEALARASRVAGDLEAVRRYLQQARDEAAEITDPEARAVIEADLDELR